MIKESQLVFDAAFSALCALNCMARDQNSLSRKESATLQRLIDCHTVSFNPGTQSGKTAWIAHAADVHLDAIVNSDGVRPNDSMSDVYSRQYVEEMSEKLMEKEFTPSTDEYRYVFVDGASMYDKLFIESLYRLFGHRDVTFVLVG